MQKLIQILSIAVVALATACSSGVGFTGDDNEVDVVAQVDGSVLLRSDIARDMPSGLTGVDSITFSRMYIENWVLSRLKMRRAEEVLSSYERDIERLVEGYRQSLIMRQLDQYYVDSSIDLEITDKQLASYYRANAASFKLDHHMVRGVVVKTPRSFRNTTTLTTALKSVAKSGSAEEVRALAEKHNLQLTDYTGQWASYSDFLSSLPTVRSSSYNDLLGRSGVQQMSSDDANFYFIIVDVARKGETAPMECVEDDIRRRIYAERRAEIVGRYEAELKREAVTAGRVNVADSLLLSSMGYSPEEVETKSEMPAVDEIIVEEVIADEVVAE
ncbi:MAG: hypothetical protein IJZ78_04980 [Alistipes sp.]|nr:hypothetical protein [Alistipes sp.]